MRSAELTSRLPPTHRLSCRPVAPGYLMQRAMNTSTDIVEDNVWSAVGVWGGSCTCPNGETYFVGDNLDFCESLWAFAARTLS